MERTIAAKLPEPVFLQLKARLAAEDMSVKEFVAWAADRFLGKTNGADEARKEGKHGNQG